MTIAANADSEPRKLITVYKRDICKDNLYIFIKYINQLTWSDVLSEHNVNAAFDIFHDLLCLFFKLCFPIKKITVNNKLKGSLWISKGLKISSRKNRSLRFKYYLNKDNGHKINYLSYNKIYKQCITQAQMKSNEIYISKSKNKCLASWKIINKHVNSGNSLKKYIQEIKHESIITTKPNDIANYFNDYLINSLFKQIGA